MGLRTFAAGEVADVTGYWWLFLISGGLWTVLALAVLQFDLTSVWSIAILTGVVLCLAAITEFWVASVAPSWKWAHIALGILFLAGGIIAFAWPHSTFVVLARLIGWYLLFVGVYEVVESISFRGTDLWWLRLIAGLATIGIAFWAVGSLSRSSTLLVLWVGLAALFRGIQQILLAFEVRSVHEDAKAMSKPSGSDGGRADRSVSQHA